MIVVCVLLKRKQCVILSLISGALSIPGSFLTIVFIPQYWEPVRVFDWVLGIEDILFSFATGTLVWALSFSGDSARVCFRSQLKVVFYRYTKIWMIGALFMFVVSLINIAHLMTQIVIVMLATALNVGGLSRKLVYKGIRSALVFGCIYSIYVVVCFQIFPHFGNQWSWENLWGITLFSVPIEEFLWAFVFGYTWPILMIYTLNISFQTAKASSERPA